MGFGVQVYWYGMICGVRYIWVGWCQVYMYVVFVLLLFYVDGDFIVNVMQICFYVCVFSV